MSSELGESSGTNYVRRLPHISSKPLFAGFIGRAEVETASQGRKTPHRFGQLRYRIGIARNRSRQGTSG